MRSLVGLAAALLIFVPAAGAQEAPQGEPLLDISEPVPPAVIGMKTCLYEELGGDGCAGSTVMVGRRVQTWPAVRVTMRLWCFFDSDEVTVRITVGRRWDERSACGTRDARERTIRMSADAQLVNAGRGGVRRFPVRVSVGDDQVARGTLTVRRTTFTPAISRRIYSQRDFDAYFNICVRGGYEVYASGGDVYCTFSRPALSTFRTELDLERLA